MEKASSVKTVQAWQNAANNQVTERLLRLSDPNIEIVGPRGSGYGHELLRAWLARAGLTLETKRVFARGDTVVLAQHGVWRSPETGVVTGEADLASSFKVSRGVVTRFSRHEKLAEALIQGRLTEADEVSPRGLRFAG